MLTEIEWARLSWTVKNMHSPTSIGDGDGVRCLQEDMVLELLEQYVEGFGQQEKLNAADQD